MDLPENPATSPAGVASCSFSFSAAGVPGDSWIPKTSSLSFLFISENTVVTPVGFGEGEGEGFGLGVGAGEGFGEGEGLGLGEGLGEGDGVDEAAIEIVATAQPEVSVSHHLRLPPSVYLPSFKLYEPALLYEELPESGFSSMVPDHESLSSIVTL